MLKIEKILTLFSKRFILYDAIVLIILLPLALLSVVTNLFIFRIILISDFILMIINAVDIFKGAALYSLKGGIAGAFMPI